jgi:polyhydroxyalkanoate synthesis regulator phasin
VVEKKSQEKQPRKEEPKMDKLEFGVEKAGLEYVNFMRNSFRNWMDGATLMQNQGERLLEVVVKQGQAGYDEGSKILREWVSGSKKASDEFQKTIEANLAKLEDYLSKRA